MEYRKFNDKYVLRLEKGEEVISKKSRIDYLVIASQCAHWRGNPLPFGAPWRTDCHTSGAPRSESKWT